MKTKTSSKPRSLLSKAELGGNATSFPEWTSKEKVEVLPQGLIGVLNLSKHWHQLLTENKGNQKDLVQHPESVVLGIDIRWSSSTMAYYRMGERTQ